MERARWRSWSMYSWANHGWVTTVSTVLIGPWLLALATAHRPGSATLLRVGGLRLRAESYPSLAITVAALAQLLVLPLLGAAADVAARRRRWLAASCGLGAVIAVALAATGGSAYLAAGGLFVAGSVVFGASDVVYNSYLPLLAAPQDRDALSSTGFAYGYLGGGLLLAVNLALLLAHHSLGISKATAVRVCFVSAGLWWAGFGLAAVARLPHHEPQPTTPLGAGRTSATHRLVGELRALQTRPQTRRYLIAYLLFSDAISAVIALSSTFITHELYHDSASRAATFLFALILGIQFVAMAGAVALRAVAARIGTQRTVLASLLVWCGVVVYTYAALHSTGQAVAAGVVIGLVLGGSQALARSLWSQLVPRGLEATYFGLFEVANEGTAWIAPLLFTVVVNITGSFRQAILSLLVLFVAGGALLACTDLDAAEHERATAECAPPGPAA